MIICLTTLLDHNLLSAPCRQNLLADCLQGCFVVTCTLCAFISLVWLREQIVHGGAPQWLEQNQPPLVPNQPNGPAAANEVGRLDVALPALRAGQTVAAEVCQSLHTALHFAIVGTAAVSHLEMISQCLFIIRDGGIDNLFDIVSLMFDLLKMSID